MSRVDFRLYLITDRHQTQGRSLSAVLSEAVHAGVRAIQLRERDLNVRIQWRMATEIQGVIRPVGGKLFINDRIDLVMALGADGVHLRSSSLPVRVARRILGSGPLIGASSHSAEEVRRAAGEGADFIVLGPVYETPSKLAYGPPLGLRTLEEGARSCSIPIFAIGGITESQVPQVMRAGAYGVAVISAIHGAPSVEKAARAILTAVQTSK